MSMRRLHEAAGARWTQRSGTAGPEDFGAFDEEYGAALRGAGLHDRSYRALIEIGGADRARWLNGLVTNAVKSLTHGEGNYGFGLNAQGRILFDYNILVGAEATRLAVERSHVGAAMAHLDRHLFNEDVTLVDRSNEFACIALLGPESSRVLSQLGIDVAAHLPSQRHRAVELAGRSGTLLRNDFAGVVAAELWIDSADAEACWTELLTLDRHVALRPVGLAAVQALRIEAGIPWPGDDITPECLPAETGQIERAVSFTKGCYVGQEIVARMDARDAAAKRLIGVVIDGDTVPSVPASLSCGGVEVGRLTSVCRSPHAGRIIGLGYVRTSSGATGTPVTIEAGAARLSGTVADLPFRR